MASLGNVGHAIAAPNMYPGWQWWTADKQPTSVSMLFTGVLASEVPFAFAVLYRNSVVNGRTRADGSGVFAFYDMDNSGSQVYAISTYTQDGPTGEGWVATVVGTAVTITKTFGAQRALAAAFAG